jgi:hypothetical protein
VFTNLIHVCWYLGFTSIGTVTIYHFRCETIQFKIFNYPFTDSHIGFGERVKIWAGDLSTLSKKITRASSEDNNKKSVKKNAKNGKSPLTKKLTQKPIALKAFFSSSTGKEEKLAFRTKVIWEISNKEKMADWATKREEKSGKSEDF